MRKIKEFALFFGFSIASLIVLFPVLYTCIASFSSIRMAPQQGTNIISVLFDMFAIDTPTINQYYQLLIDQFHFIRAFWNSLLYAFFVSFCNVLLSLLSGYVLAKVKFLGSNIITMIYIIAAVMPFQVSLLPMYIMSKSLGIYNTWSSIIFPGISAPIGVFLMRQFVMYVPDEMIESVRIDTNSSCKMLARIVAPTVRPGMVTLFTLMFSENWNLVEQPMVLLRDPAKFPLSLLLNNTSVVGKESLYAAAVIYMMPVVILYLLLKNEIIDGLGGIKV